jgi:methionine synthase II (cobalamin-independent)
MSNLYAPFRYDYVGSFLRPAELKKARADYEAGAITADQLKAVEDQCITELVAKQKAAGYHVITDGEFRRATWHLDFMWGFDGVGHKKTNTGLPFHGEAAMIDDTFVTGRIGLSGEHPFVDHFRYVKALEDEKTIAKQTIPAPAQTLAQFWMPFARKHTEAFYSSAKPLMDDIAQAYIAVLHQLYDAGCRNVLNFGGSFRVHTPSNDRHQEFNRVMEENGASVKTIEMAWNMMEYDYYCRIMEQYMDIYRDIDGVFTTDIGALYCLNIANQRGVKVPEELHIVGYDAVDMTRLFTPKLTSIAQDIPGLATACVDTMMDLLDGKKVKMEQILPVSIQKGGTV